MALTAGLVSKHGCTCRDTSAIYECTLMGTSEGFTVWQGTALNCTGNEITLVHSRFMSGEGAFGECNDGAIWAQNVSVENGYYISQLSVRINSEVLGRGIRCLSDDTTITEIGYSTITATTGSLFKTLLSCVCNLL